MKKKIFVLFGLIILAAGLGFSSPRLQFDLGASIPFFPKTVENFSPAFKYDLQFGIPVYAGLGIFVNGGQTFAKFKSTESNVLLSTILFGLDYRFVFAEKNCVRPSLSLGAFSLLAFDSLSMQGMLVNAKLYYDRILTENLELNVGAGISLMFYNGESPFDTYSPLDFTVGVSYMW